MKIPFFYSSGRSQADETSMQMPRRVGSLQRPYVLDDASGIPRSWLLFETEIRRVYGGEFRPFRDYAHHGGPPERQPEESEDETASDARPRLPGTFFRLLFLRPSNRLVHSCSGYQTITTI